MSTLPPNTLTVAEQNELAAKSVPWWVVAAVLVLAVAALVGAAVYIAHRIGFAAGKEHAVVITKACPAPEREPTRFTCDRAERKHYRDVCLARIRGEI